MKFLEATKQKPQPSVIPEENKMKPGSRLDQRNPEDLISSPFRGRPTKSTTEENKTQPPTRPEIVKLAKSLDVDLTTVTGTGKHGEITARDVHAASNKTKQGTNEHEESQGE